MKLKHQLVAAAAMLAAMHADTAWADDAGGEVYVAAGVTLSLLSNVEQVTSDAPVPGSTLTLFSENGSSWGGYAAIGYDFGSFRAEAEFGRTENDSDRFNITSPFMASIPQDGETDITRYMANAYYDFGSRSAWIRPFVGAGIGAARVHDFRFAGTAAAPDVRFVHLDDKATVFAWQAMAGASLPVTRSLELTAQYRWFDAGNIGGLVTNLGQDFTIDVQGHHFDVGARLKL